MKKLFRFSAFAALLVLIPILSRAQITIDVSMYCYSESGPSAGLTGTLSSMNHPEIFYMSQTDLEGYLIFDISIYPFETDTMMIEITDICGYEYEYTFPVDIQNSSFSGEAYVCANPYCEHEVYYDLNPDNILEATFYEITPGARSYCTWDFGDGSPLHTVTNLFEDPVLHTFPGTGYYDVT